jgi:hypothetical protein
MSGKISFRINKSTAIKKKQEAVSRHEAILLFNEAKKRLLDINRWHLLYEEQVEKFRLTDHLGHAVDKEEPEAGDLICIERMDSDQLSEWFRIDQFYSEKNLLKDEEQFGFSVKAIKDPFKENDKERRNYKRDTVITFMIVRNANIVVAMEQVRDGKRSLLKSIVQSFITAVTRFVSVFGIRSHQWESLVHGIITGPGHRWDKKVI